MSKSLQPEAKNSLKYIIGLQTPFGKMFLNAQLS